MKDYSDLAEAKSGKTLVTGIKKGPLGSYVCPRSQCPGGKVDRFILVRLGAFWRLSWIASLLAARCKREDM